MKSLLPFFILLFVLASCTTAYKTAQTPDDVYYSPARPHDEYVRTESAQPKYRYDEQNEDDRYLRMKVRNRRTWSDLDYYYSDPYAYNYNRNSINYNSLYYNTPWNYYSSWNYYYNPYSNYYNYNFPYYNPYGSKVIIVNRRPPVYNRPRTFNLNTYNPQLNGSASNPKPNSSRRTYRGDNRSFNYNANNNNNSYNRENNSGKNLRNIFDNNNSSSNNTPSRSERSSNTQSTNTSPSRSNSSNNAPVRKF